MKMSKTTRIMLSFVILISLLILLVLFSAITGSIKVNVGTLFKGLFVEYDPTVAVIYNLRFPRIIVALLGGSALAVSGVLLQAVMKNPMTDPGIIGISSSASLFTLIIVMIFPSYYFLSPLFSVFGGLFAYLLLYLLAWDGGVRPVRLILVGVSLNIIFIGIAKGLKALSGGNLTKTQAIIEGNVAQKTWSDVQLLVVYLGVFLLVSIFTARLCNVLTIEDKLATSVGINVSKARFIVALIAVVLASVTTAVVGVIAFVGLLVPHIGRLLVTGEHKYLIPFSALLGAFLLLLSDTLGRLIAYPYEVSAGVIMSIVGGMFFIVLLRVGGKEYGN